MALRTIVETPAGLIVEAWRNGEFSGGRQPVLTTQGGLFLDRAAGAKLNPMHKITAYERRERLDADQLDQLLFALRDDVERYREGTRGYNPEKMARYGAPHLAKLEKQVGEVERLIAAKRKGIYPLQQS